MVRRHGRSATTTQRLALSGRADLLAPLSVARADSPTATLAGRWPGSGGGNTAHSRLLAASARRGHRVALRLSRQAHIGWQSSLRLHKAVAAAYPPADPRLLHQDNFTSGRRQQHLALLQALRRGRLTLVPMPSYLPRLHPFELVWVDGLAQALRRTPACAAQG